MVMFYDVLLNIIAGTRSATVYKQENNIVINYIRYEKTSANGIGTACYRCGTGR